MWTHALLTILIQIIAGLTLRNWWIGGVFMVAFYLGREITQAEYRWISTFGEGLRSNMPWWGGLSHQAWNVKSALDVLLPVAVTAAIFTIYRAIKERVDR